MLKTVRDPRAIAEVRQIGNEFASVEALWSQFEIVMDRENDDGVKEGGGSGGVEKVVGRSTLLEEQETTGNTINDVYDKGTGTIFSVHTTRQRGS